MAINFFFDNTPLADQIEIRTRATRVVALAETLAALPANNAILTRWFGTSAADAKKKMELMKKYLKDKCRAIRFVKQIADGAKLCDGVLVENSDYGQVIRPVQSMAKPVVLSGGGVTSRASADPLSQIASGIKVFLGSAYFDPTTDDYERDNCIYHEIFHKVVPDSWDIDYGVDDCEDLAIDDPTMAIWNPDNYGYALAEHAGHAF